MASKFDKAKGAKGIKDVAQTSNEQANLITIKYYDDENLMDYPRNNEDLENTEDLEKSIEEQGFTDPIEITDFDMEEGKYMIVSGHRRRMAGRKKGMKKFPCILRKFKSEQEVYNYVLYSNAQRDSAKDPLLFAKRYKMHEEYLKETGFKGSLREEIASRLGLKPAQADRYNNMNKVILPLWDMVRDGAVGMSSLTDSGLYTHTPEEQTEILQMMNECLDNGNELTRPTVKKIVNSWREGKRSWIEVIRIEMQNETMTPPVDSGTQAGTGDGVSVMNINTEPGETKEKEPSPLDRNNEINYDFSHREGLPSGTDPYAGERLTEEDMQAIELASRNGKEENEDINDEPDAEDSECEENTDVIEREEKSHLSEDDKKLLVGEKISKNLSSLEVLLNDFYEFSSDEKAELTIKTMCGLIKTMIAEMDSIADRYGKEDVFKDSVEEIENELKHYKA